MPQAGIAVKLYKFIKWTHLHSYTWEKDFKDSHEKKKSVKLFCIDLLKSQIYFKVNTHFS